jgi:hypothetical protein
MSRPKNQKARFGSLRLLDSLASKMIRQGGAEAVDFRPERVVEEIADLRHPSFHPLTRTSQVGMAKLRRLTMPSHQGFQQREDRIGADLKTLRQLAHNLPALLRQSLHGAFPSPCTRRSACWARACSPVGPNT